MPFVPAPNIIQVELRQTLFGQHIENRIMLDNLASVEAIDLSTVAVLAWDWWVANLAPLLSVSLTLSEVVATDMSAIDGAQYTYVAATPAVGAQTSAMLPNETALCLSLRSGNRGRSARGRMFIPGLTSSAMEDPNTVTTTFASNIQAAGAALISVFDPERPLVIVSYFSEGIARPGGPVYYVVTSAVLTDRIVDSQRRRKPGVGS